MLDKRYHTIRNFDDRLRAAQDTIRRVHLRGVDATQLLNSVISTATKGEEPQQTSVESFTVQNDARSMLDVSEFFAWHYLPKLKCFCLSGCKISSWDLLKSQTTTLTTLSRVQQTITHPDYIPTA